MKKSSAYTLIEILVALAIFAIIATVTSGTIYHVFSIRADLTKKADQLNSLELAMIVLERDTEQAITRSVLNQKMHISPAFIGEGKYMEFTRGGAFNPLSHTNSNLRRVAYRCDQDKLIRIQWPVLDGGNRNMNNESVLLEHLSECHFSYLTASKEVLQKWEASEVKNNHETPPQVPIAIQVALAYKKQGDLNWLFIIPESFYGN